MSTLDSRDDGLETIPSPPLLTRIRLRSVVWLVLLGLLLSLQVWFPRLDAEVNDTYNVDNGGRNALFQFVERRLPDVERNHDPLVQHLEWLPAETTLCILGPARYPTSREWDALLAWVNRGGRLLFATTWDEPALEIAGLGAKVTSTGIKPLERTWGSSVEKSEKGKPNREKTEQANKTAETVEPKPDVPAPTTPAPVTPVTIDPARQISRDLRFTWKSEGSIVAPGAEVLLQNALGAQVVRQQHGLGTVVLVASDYIFSNAALFEAGQQNGVLVTRLFAAARVGESIEFDESLNETGTPRVVGLLLDPVLRPTTLQLATLLLLFAWRGNRRFGALLPPATTARHDVADHTNSLGNLYYKAHHATGALREYLEQLKSELRLRFAGAHSERVLLPIAQQAGLTLEEVQRRLAEADAACRKPQLSRREAAQQIRKLAELRQAARKRREGRA